MNFYNLTNQSLVTYADNVKHICIPHALCYDKWSGNLLNGTFTHFLVHLFINFPVRFCFSHQSRNKISEPTALSTDFFTILMPRSLLPDAPGISIIAGSFVEE